MKPIVITLRRRAATINVWAFTALAGLLLIGSAIDGPSAHEEAVATAEQIADLQRDSAEISAMVAGMDRAIEREAGALCKRTHGASAVHWWTAENRLVCSRNAALGAVDRAQAGGSQVASAAPGGRP